MIHERERPCDHAGGMTMQERRETGDGRERSVVDPIELARANWVRHGWGEAAITAMINNGKTNEMPAQAGKLTEPQIRVLTAYVWGKSNRPAAAR